MNRSELVIAVASQFLILTILSAGPVVAVTYVIDPEGTADFPTIQEAISAALDGDIIELTNGVFGGDGNRDLDYLGKSITVRSQSGNPEMCVIDCQGSETDPHRGLNFVSGEQAGSVLAGITVRNGWVGLPEHGGAVRCENGASPTFDGCVFSMNSGSAVYCRDKCWPTFSNCYLTQNIGRFGGGIRCHTSNLTISGCDFIENEVELEGGAIYCHYSAAEIADCVFARNAARYSGAINFEEFSEAYVTDCLFAGNSAWNSAGAVTLFLGCTGVFERCTFSGNTAVGWSGALFSEKISNTYLRNCTFWGNASAEGTIVCGNIQCILENTIVAFSTEGPGVVAYEDVELTCCDIYGNAGGDWVGSIADQYGINGNISKDPLFCHAEEGDLTLNADSPCAPFSPPNPECDLIGAWPVGCGPTAWRLKTWGQVKAMFR